MENENDFKAAENVGSIVNRSCDNFIRAVTFDMDGLMFNTEDLYDEVISLVLSRVGKEYSLDSKLAIMGLPGPKAFAVLQSKLDLTGTYEQFEQEIDTEFKTILPRRIEKMPGLDALLDLLESRGIPKAIATSSHRPFAELALSTFDLMDRFEFILCGNEVTHGKPHPEIYLTSAQLLNVSPGEMLAFEDSLYGSRAAVTSGAFTVAVPTWHCRGLDYSHANLVVDSLADPRVLALFDASRTR